MARTINNVPLPTPPACYLKLKLKTTRKFEIAEEVRHLTFPYKPLRCDEIVHMEDGDECPEHLSQRVVT